MSETTPESERFLEAVERKLPFAEGERTEILDELRGHLADCAVALRDAGLEPIEAERAAVARLAPADRLADELTRARRDTSRLLAAAGAGVWGAVRGGLWGGLIGFGVVMVAAVALAAANNAALRFLSAELFSADSGTNSIIGIVILGIAALVAGRVVTPTVAARAGYAGRLVRRATVPLGAVMLLAYALLVWSGPLNWPSVVLLVSLPLWWGAGAWQIRLVRLGFPRRLAIGLVAALVVSLGASTIVGPASPQLPASGVSSGPGFDRMGAPLADGLSGAGAGGTSYGDAYRELSIDVPDRGLLAGWNDLRIEAWRGIDPTRGWGLDPGETAPFLTGPVVWSAAGTSPDGNHTWYESSPWPPNAATLTGGLRLDRSPGVTDAWLVLTGVAPDGTRHLLSDPSGTQVFFSGTALDWFGAVLAGH